MRDVRSLGRPAMRRLSIPLRAPLGILRARPVEICLAVAAVIAVAPVLERFWGVGGVVACAVSYACGTHESLRKGGLAVAALAISMQASMGLSEFPNIEIGFVTLIPFWLGHQVRMRGVLVSRLAERTRELRVQRDAFAQLSVRHERALIARELHDIVSHHLAVIVVQAGAGRMATTGSGQQASERFAVIRQSGDEALSEMARLVDILHAEGSRAPDTGARWQLLVDEARAGGLDVQLTRPPADARLPVAIADEAYRIVREGLTNAIKHAPGAQVAVRVAQRDDRLEIEVQDHGARDRAQLAEAGAGLGLVGMRERIEAIGGTLSAGPDSERGWHLSASLPITAAAVTPAR